MEECSPEIQALQNALDSISLNDANEVYNQIAQLVASGNAVVQQGVAIQTSVGRILHPTLPAIYNLAWQFIRQYNALGLPTQAELNGHVTRTANVVNLRR